MSFFLRRPRRRSFASGSNFFLCARVVIFWFALVSIANSISRAAAVWRQRRRICGSCGPARVRLRVQSIRRLRRRSRWRRSKLAIVCAKIYDLSLAARLYATLALLVVGAATAAAAKVCKRLCFGRRRSLATSTSERASERASERVAERAQFSWSSSLLRAPPPPLLP